MAENDFDSPQEFAWNFLSQDACLIINKKMILSYGLDAAIFLADMISKHRYFYNKGMIDKDGYFYNEQKDREFDTGLSFYRQSQAIIILEKAGILFPVIRKGGVPPRQKFKINYENLQSQLLKFLSLNIKNLRFINKNKLNKNKEILSKESIRESVDSPLSSNQSVSRWKRNAPVKIKRNNRHEQQSRLKPEKKQKEKKISILPGTDAERIVNYWNNLKSPNSRFKFIVHKRLDSNCMADTVKWIEELRKGKFASVNGKNWRQDFFEKNHIPFPLTESIMPREIYHLMNIYLDFFKDGFWPENKKHLPTTLPDFILSGNPKTGKTSYLLRCKFNPPGRMNGKPVDYRPEYTDVFKHFGILRDIAEDDMPKIYSGIQSIENRILREKLFDWEDARIKGRFGRCVEKGMEGLFEDYANFILDEYNSWELEDVFNQWGKVFKDWLRTRQQEFEF